MRRRASHHILARRDLRPVGTHRCPGRGPVRPDGHRYVADLGHAAGHQPGPLRADPAQCVSHLRAGNERGPRPPAHCRGDHAGGVPHRRGHPVGLPALRRHGAELAARQLRAPDHRHPAHQQRLERRLSAHDERREPVRHRVPDDRSARLPDADPHRIGRSRGARAPHPSRPGTDVRGTGTARVRPGSCHRIGVRYRSPAAGRAPCGRRRRDRGGGRHPVRHRRLAHAVDRFRVVRRCVRGGHPGRHRQRARHAAGRRAGRRDRGRHDRRLVAGRRAHRRLLARGACAPVPPEWPPPEARWPRMSWRGLAGIGVAVAVLASLPWLRQAFELPTFFLSFGTVVLSWAALATSWNILSGYSGYFSFGQGGFYGVGVYTTAVLTGRHAWDFLPTVPLAGAVAALLGLLVGLVAFRLRSLRGEVFALLTLAVPFIVAPIVRLSPSIDGGQGITVPVPDIPEPLTSFQDLSYLLCLAIASIAVVVAYIAQRARLGWALFAIRDAEGVAEGLGVPTFRTKMVAIAIT